MSEPDGMIREHLASLRRAPIPPPPTIAPAASEPRMALWGRWAAAAVMLIALAGALYLAPQPAESPAESRLAAIERRLPEVRDDELRELLCREIELLRRELAPAGR